MQQPHWRYFVALSEDFHNTTRFVEPAPENFQTYSIEFARLYLAIGSEIDVVAKLLCQKIDNTANTHNIDGYRSVILAKYPELPDVEIVAPSHLISLTP